MVIFNSYVSLPECKYGRSHGRSMTPRSKMNPLQRQLGDRALKEDPLVRDDLRRALWSEPGREMMKDPMKKSMK